MIEHRYKVGELVMWRGGHGEHPEKPATIVGTGEENGLPVYDLDNNHWCYEDQLRREGETWRDPNV